MHVRLPSSLLGRTAAAIAASAAMALIAATGRSMLGAVHAFPDVPESYPYAQAITFLRKNGIMTGHDDGTFRPNVSLQRIELVKIVMTLNSTAEQRAACTERMATEPVPFSDIETERGIWYWPYLCLARERGVINGYPDGSFKPTRAVSFAELSKIIANAFGIEPIVLVEDDAPWYARPMQALYDYDLVPPSVQEPAVPVSRGETAEVLYRILRQSTDGAPGDDSWHGAAPSNDPDADDPFDFEEWRSRFSWTESSKGIRPIRGATSTSSIYLEDESSSSDESSDDSSESDETSSATSRSSSTSSSASRTTSSARSSSSTSNASSTSTMTSSSSSSSSQTTSSTTSSTQSSSTSSFPVERYPAIYDAHSYDDIRDRKFAFRDRNGDDFLTFFSIYGFLPNVVTTNPAFLPERNAAGAYVFDAETVDRWEWLIRDNAEFFGVADPDMFRFDKTDPGAQTYVATDPAFPFPLPLTGQYYPFGSLRLTADMRMIDGEQRLVAGISGHWWPDAGFPNPRFTFEQVAERLIDKQLRLEATVRSVKVRINGQLQNPGQSWAYGIPDDHPVMRWTPCDPPAWCPEPDAYEWEDAIQPEDLSINLMYMGFIPRQSFSMAHEDTTLELRLVHRVTVRRVNDDGTTIHITKYYDAVRGEELAIPLMCPAQEKAWPQQTGFDPSALGRPAEDPDQDIGAYPYPITSAHRIFPPDDPESWQGLSTEELVDRRWWEFIDRNPDVQFDVVEMDNDGIIRRIVTSDPRFVQQVDDDVPEYPLEWSQIDFDGGEEGAWRALLEDNAEFFGLERGFNMRHIGHCPSAMDTTFGRIPRSLDIGYVIEGNYDLALRMMPSALPTGKSMYASGGARITKYSGLYSASAPTRRMSATLAMNFYPDAKLPEKPVLARWEIEDRFRDDIGMDNLQIRLGPIITRSGNGTVARLVYAVGTHFEDRMPMGIWEWMIDAMTGEEVTP